MSSFRSFKSFLGLLEDAEHRFLANFWIFWNFEAKINAL